MNSRQKGENQTGTTAGPAGTVNLAGLGKKASPIGDVRNEPANESQSLFTTHATTPAPNSTDAVQPGEPKQPVVQGAARQTDRTPRTGTFRRSGTRRPITSGDKLRAPAWAIQWAKENDMHLHFCIDSGDGDHINDLMELGYQPVEVPKGQETKRFPGTKSVDEASPLGRYVSKIANKGSGQRAYLLAIPNEIYDELQQEHKTERAAVEQTILQGQNIEAGYSRTETTITIGGGANVPVGQGKGAPVRVASA